MPHTFTTDRALGYSERAAPTKWIIISTAGGTIGFSKDSIAYRLLHIPLEQREQFAEWAADKVVQLIDINIGRAVGYSDMALSVEEIARSLDTKGWDDTWDYGQSSSPRINTGEQVSICTGCTKTR
jgi:hypothetical protein